MATRKRRTIFWHDEMLSEASTPPAETNKSILPAAIHETLLTSSAVTVIDDWGDDHTAADTESIRYAFADLFNHLSHQESVAVWASTASIILRTPANSCPNVKGTVSPVMG
jgi:hypothetical protein